MVIQLKIPIFTPLEQGRFLSEKHRNEAGAEVGAFIEKTGEQAEFQFRLKTPLVPYAPLRLKEN